jgi:N-acetylglucosaminyldiphosphoundecaprenol N-acetyl-beta-D-mannosaminyltransferase
MESALAGPVEVESARGAVERPARTEIAGVPVDRVDMAGAVGVVRRVIEAGERCRILVVNANKAWLARRDGRLRGMLAAAELVIPEWAMVWAAERLGRAGVHHVGGITLMVRLLEEAEGSGWTVYLLGARPEVVEALASRLRRERPALRLVGWHHGYLDATGDARVRAELATLRPDLLFVAMGSPLQEYWIDGVWGEPGPRVALGVGGSFDVLAGLKRDAPGWARGRGLEWLYRLAQDPRRLWRRYLVTNGWFVWTVWRERLARRRPGWGAGEVGGEGRGGGGEGARG